MKIRVTEFCQLAEAAKAETNQAYLLGWSGRTDPDGNLRLPRLQGAEQLRRHTARGGRQGAHEARTFSDRPKRKAVYEQPPRTCLAKATSSTLSCKVLIAHTTKLEGFRRCRMASCACGLRLK